jgi:GNAT superfamily N-acetyltransferase
MNCIKPLTSLDGYVVRQLFRSIFHESEDPYFSAAWISRDRTASLGWWDPETETLLGAAIVVGSVYAKLEYIFVSESHQGSGIGSQLLTAVLALKPNLHLVPVEDPAIFRWYEKHGFHVDSKEEGRRIYLKHSHYLRGPSLT